MKRSHWNSQVTAPAFSRNRRPGLALVVCVIGCFSFTLFTNAQETIPDGSFFANQGLQTGADSRVSRNDASVAQPSMDEYETEAPEPIFGFANGFVLASPDLNTISRRDYAFSVRLSGWMQLRHALFESDGPNRGRNEFSLERIRVGIDGHAYRRPTPAQSNYKFAAPVVVILPFCLLPKFTVLLELLIARIKEI